MYNEIKITKLKKKKRNEPEKVGQLKQWNGGGGITKGKLYSLKNQLYIVVCCLVTKLCLTACDPMDCSPPGFSVHGTLLKIYIYM